jgi:RNA recognition motif-containing protein
MSKKLFVGSLSWDTSEEVLRGKFEQFGEIIEVKIITDRDTGRSRGFGFVTFEDSGDADKAVTEMDGSELDGRTIKVNEAQEKPGRGGGRSGGPHGGRGGPQGGRGGYGGRGGKRERW